MKPEFIQTKETHHQQKIPRIKRASHRPCLLKFCQQWLLIIPLSRFLMLVCQRKSRIKNFFNILICHEELDYVVFSTRL